MSFRAIERLRLLPLTAVGAGGGWLAVTLAMATVDPEPPLRSERFDAVIGEQEPLEAHALKPLTIPFPFGDFDAVTEVELPTGAALDLCFRLVRPQLQAEPFHARFATLRISTERSGPGFASREEALFGPGDAGGVLVAPGHPATVHLFGRGHRVRANVAGRWLPWFEVPDDFGGLSYVHRGPGTTLVRYLNVQPLQRARAADPWLWASLTGGALGLLFALLGVRVARSLVALATLPAVGALAGVAVFSLLLPQTRPSTTAALAAALSSLPAALAIALRARWRGALVAVLAVLALWELAARIEVSRLAPLEDPRLGAYFGRASGSMPFDALVGQLAAATAIHRAREVDRRIVFAGGGHWFEAGGTRGLAENLAPLTAARTAQLVSTEVDGVVVPTLWSTVDQQVALIADFVDPRFDPDLVVFAISSDELEPSERYPPRAVLDGTLELPTGAGSVLAAAWLRQLRGDVAPGTPATIAAALERLAALGAERGFVVVPYLPEPLPAEAERVVEIAAGEHGWAVLRRDPALSTVELADRFANRLAGLLKP